MRPDPIQSRVVLIMVVVIAVVCMAVLIDQIGAITAKPSLINFAFCVSARNKPALLLFAGRLSLDGSGGPDNGHA